MRKNRITESLRDDRRYTRETYLARNGKNAANNARVEDMRNDGYVGLLHGNDERRGGDAGAAKEAIVVGGDEERDPEHADHVEGGDAHGDEFGGVGHRVAGIFGLAAHDADEDLVADSPCRVDGCVGEALHGLYLSMRLLCCVMKANMCIASHDLR